MNFNSVTDVITSITHVQGNGGGSDYGIKVVLNPMLNEDVYVHRYKLGFAVTDHSLDNAWPQPMRNLNNNGKLLIPNYAFPTMPETIGEFVSRIATEGDISTNSITFTLPGIADPDRAGEIVVCLFDPDDWTLASGTLTAEYSLYQG
ncbi:hypothetical protein TUM12370_10690 [Salmonella enterica subsp. enterica serovar Choleraesuis]|nr:hypothetical protein TUM12370_10690 [Salmonella enterica subsp. enterica serovar Choleraesuis]